MTSPKYACLFPGQGAQATGMLAGVAHAPAFTERYALVCAALGQDVQDALAGGESATTFLNRNEVSSLLTVLVSTLAYDLWLTQQSARPAYVAGYSVGQWTALYAAGVLPFAQLVAVVHQRAMLMNDAVAVNPGGMVGVIGLREETIIAALAPIQATGYRVAISNVNCLGNYSLAVESAALQPTLRALAAYEPKKLLTLPVAGAWHSTLLATAAIQFATYLASVELAPPQLPVIDNVTGGFLPNEPVALRTQLAHHLSAPVLWQKGVEQLIAVGCSHFIEIGYGRLLTQFGFFINRACRHEAFYNTQAQVRHNPSEQA